MVVRLGLFRWNAFRGSGPFFFFFLNFLPWKNLITYAQNAVMSPVDDSFSFKSFHFWRTLSRGVSGFGMT